MLGKIQDELAKMIAAAIFDYGKKKGDQFQGALKSTELRSSGRGLPAPLVVAYHNAFIGAVSSRTYTKDGYAKFQHRGGEQQIDLLLRAPLVAKIKETDWAAAANRTADGVEQISALGGADEYQAAVANSIETLFDYTIATYVGAIQPTVTSTVWVLLSEVIAAAAAPEKTTDFQDKKFIYWASGTQQDVAEKLRLSKSLLTAGSLWWKRRASPSAGPYLTVNQ